MVHGNLRICSSHPMGMLTLRPPRSQMMAGIQPSRRCVPLPDRLRLRFIEAFYRKEGTVALEPKSANHLRRISRSRMIRLKR